MDTVAMITQFDTYAVKMMTGLPTFASQAEAEKIAINAYNGGVAVKKVSLTTMSGQVVTAWVIQRDE